MKPYKVNVSDIPWQSWAKGRFASDDRLVNEHVRSRGLDLCVTRLAPGMANCPFHFHHASEEMFYVLEGAGTLRYGSETVPIIAGDVIACPPGPEGAHQILNTSDAPLVYLAISTEPEIEVCEYPDSGKVAVVASAKASDPGYRAVFRHDAKVDYFEGEDLGTGGDGKEREHYHSK